MKVFLVFSCILVSTYAGVLPSSWNFDPFSGSSPFGHMSEIFGSSAGEKSTAVAGTNEVAVTTGEVSAVGRQRREQDPLDEDDFDEDEEDESLDNRDARQYYYPGGGQANANQMSNAMSGNFGTSVATGQANAQGGYGYSPYYNPYGGYLGQGYGQYGQNYGQPYGYGYYGGLAPGTATASQVSNAISGMGGTSMASAGGSVGIGNGK